MLSQLRNRLNRFRRIHIERLHPQQFRADLLAESTLDSSYVILVISSCTIATLGLLSNSAAVIIGAMIIAPLMLPIRGIAFGALQGNVLLFRNGMISVIVGTLLSAGIAYGIGLLVRLPSYGSEVLARSAPNLLDLGIAMAAGGVSGYAKVEPKVSGTLAGTAIAVALMPPICVIGLGLAQMNGALSLGATLLYLTNLLGITLSCMLIFLLAGYVSLRRARKALTGTVLLTSALLLPLGVSFARLLQQAHLETSVRQALLSRTVTFQRLELLSTETNWLTNPPEVRLQVRAQDPVTPRQVQLLEEFVAREMGRPFVLIFEVGRVEEVRREEAAP
ncbi:MAG: DUF389 domain-containing protein [Synechococcales cyanobacterium M58_A2018_015]|nr:DUF389 domain-containing protein [Synechococcales cyanobacterium M58_A2018_015]